MDPVVPFPDPADPGSSHRRTRDRRGRGMRGPGVLRRPGSPGAKTPRSRFDDLVLEAVAMLESRWHDELGLVEYAVEEMPLVPADWDDPVPLASLIRGTAGTPTRVVVFRRPLEHRAEDRGQLRALVRAVLVEQVADLLGRSPEEVDPEG